MVINFTEPVKKELKKIGLITIQQGKRWLDEFELEMPCCLSHRVGDKIKMGAFSYILSERWQNNVIIGRYCSIAENVKLNLDRHPSDWLSTSVFQYTKDTTIFQTGAGLDFTFSRPTVIGNDVWIGDSVLIKEGIAIGDGAIVGCGAVVTKDVPPYAIVAGVPARIMRYRFTPEIIEKLLELKWWDYDYRDFLQGCKNNRGGPFQPGQGGGGHIDFDTIEAAIRQISSLVNSGSIRKYQGRILTKEDFAPYLPLGEKLHHAMLTVRQHPVWILKQLFVRLLSAARGGGK